jgi:hypothetical protein
VGQIDSGPYTYVTVQYISAEQQQQIIKERKKHEEKKKKIETFPVLYRKIVFVPSLSRDKMK